MAISFVIAAMNAALAFFFLAEREGRIPIPAAALVIAIAIQMLGFVGRNSPNAIAPTHTAVMMQENIEVGAPGKEVEQLTQPQELQQFSELAVFTPRYMALTGVVLRRR